MILNDVSLGTLPTFLEVSESFSSAQVSEDTLLLQLWNNAHLFNNTNKNQTTTSSLVLKSVVMGDDTWDNLFGKYIDRSYPFPSFDIQDLDTVDDGILSTIWSELEKYEKRETKEFQSKLRNFNQIPI